MGDHAPEALLGRRLTLYVGDCRDVLAALPAASVDAVVTDPPYGINFMGRGWDAADNVAFRPETWSAVLRVLKPGGHLLAFSATRTYHRMVCAVEGAGFEIRDQVAWLYGRGFPKNHDVSKAIDDLRGAKREVVGTKAGLPGYSLRQGRDDSVTYGGGVGGKGDPEAECAITAPATPEGARWEGWGTALKPAMEPIVVARKPLAEPSVARQVLATGTGAINIDGCRVEVDGTRPLLISRGVTGKSMFGSAIGGCRLAGETTLGRWPANVVHDGSDEVVSRFPSAAPARSGGSAGAIGYHGGGRGARREGNDEEGGSAARFFYCAKASKAERLGSRHVTVKPVALMRWLVRLVTPPGGVVLDPFAGTGTTGEAAFEEGARCVLIEQDESHVEDIRRRLAVSPDAVRSTPRRSRRARKPTRRRVRRKER